MESDMNEHVHRSWPVEAPALAALSPRRANQISVAALLAVAGFLVVPLAAGEGWRSTPASAAAQSCLQAEGEARLAIVNRQMDGGIGAEPFVRAASMRLEEARRRCASGSLSSAQTYFRQIADSAR
jgi:hypothetical protein